MALQVGPLWKQLQAQSPRCTRVTGREEEADMGRQGEPRGSAEDSHGLCRSRSPLREWRAGSLGRVYSGPPTYPRPL